MVCLQAEGNKAGSSALKQAPQSVYHFAQKDVFSKVHALQWQPALAYVFVCNGALSSAWSTGNLAVMWHAQTNKSQSLCSEDVCQFCML